MLRPQSSAVQKMIRKASIFAITIIISLSSNLHVLAQNVANTPAKSIPKTTEPAPAKNPATVAAPRRQQDPAGTMVGSPWTGQFGTQKTTAELMEEEREAAGRPQSEPAKPKKIRPDRKGLPQNPESPEVSRWPSQEERQLEQPGLEVQTPSTSFTGATLTETNAFPPDTMGAVGPTQFVVGVNGRLKVFDKNTGALGPLNVTMNVFFNSVRNGFSTSDPRVRFDRLSNRWFIIIINVSVPNRVLLAVSDGPTISAGTVWTFFFFQQDTVTPAGDTGCLSDYPTLGIDANALYIGVNQFCGSPLTFGGTTAFVVRKSSILGTGPIVVSAFRSLTGGPSGPGPFTPQGVDNFDPAAAEGYFIGVDNATFGTLMIRRVTNAATTPVLSGNISLTVPATTFPITVRHQGNTGGTSGQLDGLDDRLYAAYLHNGSIWTAHNIGVNNTGTTAGTRTRNGSRWYEISGVNTATPAVAQSGTLFAQTAGNDFDQRNFWIPSVMVSGQGHMAMGFSTAGTSEFVNAGTAGRLASDASGTLRAPVSLTTSTTAYNPPGDPGASGARRWGDYSYTSLDPCDNMTMWTIQEFCDATNSYAVRVVKLLAPPPATPVSASPSTVSAGQASVNVTITGTQIDGSAFFDPGAAFSCRSGASITGGITVNSVTVNSATSVTLNISTLGATDGARNVTINNPDGQSRTGTGILSITGGGGCSFSINPTSQSFSAGGGTGSVAVTAGAGCNWGATSNDSFITVTGGATGSGNGTVNYSVAANTVQSPRTGTITIAGQTFTVNQQAASSCTFTISPTSQVFSSAGGNGTVNIATQTGCAWTAQSNNAFITLTSAASGTGTGFVNFAVSANSSTSIRTGTITVAGQTFTVTQAPTSCVTSILPSSRSFTTTGGTGAMSVAAAVSCNWTSLSTVPWVTITSGGSGPGTRSLKYTVSPNSGPQRTGEIIAGGFVHTVIQAGSSCSFTINPTSQSFGSSGGTGSVGVTTATGCNWTAVSNAAFITVTSGSSGSGSGTVNYSVAANSSASQRTGTITVAGKTFTVTQAGSTGCTFSINPTSQSFSSAGGNSSVGVTAGAGCNWTAVSNAAFITITSGSSGAGNGTVNYSVAANPSASQRTGTMTIAGQTFNVTQSGTGGCTFSINPTSQSFAASGGTGSTSVTAGAGCNWTAVSNSTFITITSGSSGSGNGTVNYSVAVNPSATSRTGTVTIAGQTFTVMQSGSTSCTFTVTPLSVAIQRVGGARTATVTTTSGCDWTAVSNVPWIIITSGSSGSGSGTVDYSVVPNTTGAARTGTLTVAGRTITVKQSS